MTSFKRWLNFASERVTQIQRVFSLIVVVVVIAMAIFLINNSRQLTNDVENFLTGDNFKVLGEIANMQRDILQAQVAIKDLRLDPEGDPSEFIRRFTFSKISLRILNARANSNDGPLIFPPESYDTLNRLNEISALIEPLSELLEDSLSNPAEIRPILQELDDYLDEAADLANDFYIQQEKNRITFLSEAIDSAVRSSIVMIVASGSLLLLSLGVIYTVQRTVTIEREASERFRLASAAVNSAIYDWNVLSDWITWTEGLYEVFGYREDEIDRRIHGVWDCIHPDDLDLFKHQFDEALKNGENFAIEHRFKTAAGTYLDVSNRVQVVTDNRGQVVRMVGSIEDITERRLMLAYQESNRAKSRLLAHVSHELKTPLSAIIGYTEMIHTGIYGDVNKDQGHTLERVLANARSLLDLINSLLSQSRTENQEDNITLGLLASDDLVEIMHESVGILAESKGIALVHKIDNEVPSALIGDIGRLRQIIVNLAGNAVKFTSDGEIKLHISRPTPDRWAISIQDTGMGISDQDQKKIFEAFTQVDETLQADSRGFGLGLSIVTQLVTDLSGTVYVESELGKGSTFTVTLPLIKRMEMS